MSEIIFIDVETGGVKPTEHSLLQLGACHYMNGRVNDTFFEEIYHDTYKVTAEALDLNGIDLIEHHKRAFAKKMTIQILIHNFLKWVDNLRLKKSQLFLVGGHNTHFDKQFIEPYFRWNDYFYYSIVDTAGIAFAMKTIGILKVKNVKLDTLVDYFKVHVENRHNALDDAIASANCFTEICNLLVKKATILPIELDDAIASANCFTEICNPLVKKDTILPIELDV